MVGIGFLPAVLYALHDLWTGAAVPPQSEYTSADRIVRAVLAIALLVYVLHRRGGSLRTIGLTARWSDIPWALLLLFLSRMIVVTMHVVFADTLAPASATRVGAMDSGVLGWLMIVPSAAAEELIVRAFLMTEVAELTGSMGQAVVASVGFQALYHLYWGVPGAFLTAGTFFVSAVFYASTRRITPVILSHSLHNFWLLARQS